MACFSFHPRSCCRPATAAWSSPRAPTPTRAAAAAAARHERARHRAARVGAGGVRGYPIVGFNYRLTDIQAAIGREQLARLDGIVARRRELAARYRDALAGVPA
jgi:dTDP-4-amino-4,6-dideoxygalactose transaminase